MRESDGQNKAVGSLPILFVGIGPCAERALTEFSSLARGLILPAQGPFGLVLVNSFSGEMFTWDWPRLSEFEVPDSPVTREPAEAVGYDDARLSAALSLLVRKLRSVDLAADPASPGRIRMNSYVVIDLSAAGAVSSTTRVMRALRQVDPAHDMTVLGLTGRTALTDSACDNEWFAGWTQFLAQLQDESFAQRIYLLDGCDADKTWFERPEQLHRLGAEFLLHHGLTCRNLLRQYEQAKTGTKESLLNVCGSFGCRTIQADLPAVAERIAERLAREDLPDLYQRIVPRGWLETVEEQAQSLVDRIAGICEKTRPVRFTSSAGRRDRAVGSLVADAEMSEVIAKTVKHVCSREPLVSVCHFLRCLQPRLRKLLTRQRLWERARTRRQVIEAFRRQYDSTYGPMKSWLSDSGTQWQDRFTPKQEEPPRVAVSRPASMKGYLGGGAVLALGLTCIAAGLHWQDRLFVIAGGLLSLGSSALMALPTGWVLHTRHRIREGKETARSIPPARYRKRASLQVLHAAGALIVLGLPGFTWSLWPDVWTFATVAWAVAVAMAAGIGVALVVGCPTESRADRAGEEEAPGHADPPLWYWRAGGLVCLGLTWTVLWLGAPTQAASPTPVQWMIHIAGLLLVAAGVTVASFPRTGRALLAEHVPRVPQPLAGGLGHQVDENDLSRRISTMTAWINRIDLEPDPQLRRSQATDISHERETIFDFLAADWDVQLANAVRQELKARSDRTLKALALQPVLWSECITRELQDPRTGCSDLTSLFALQAVKAWLGSHTLAELLSFLKVDITRFERLTGRLAAPHWPAPRMEPEVSVSIIAVGKPLWDVLAPLARAGSTPPMVQLDWDSQAGVIVALRAVQGLAQGWRGFPGLPGQRQDGISRNNGREGPQ